MGLRDWFRRGNDPTQGDPRVSVWFSRGLAASELWLFGEDDLAEQVLALDDDAWDKVLDLAAYYRDPSIPVPVTETKVTSGHTTCFACMHQIEGSIRPLARSRRRAKSSLPAHLAERRHERSPLRPPN
jgi:hypothetical protein